MQLSKSNPSTGKLLINHENLVLLLINQSNRGYVERVRFQIKLFQFREHERQWKLIENFSKLVQQGHERGALKTFNRNEDLLPEMESDYGSSKFNNSL